MGLLKKIFSIKSTLTRTSIVSWVFLVSSLTIFTTLCLTTITKSSIWFDEAFGAYLIRFDFFEIAKYTASDVHPPFYYWLLKIWTMIFGNSDLALRSMSVLFGVVAIAFTYLLIKRLFSVRVANFSLIFLTLSPMLIRYGQEARMYTLVAAIAAVATYVLVCALNSKSRKLWITYGVLVGIGMWTHYFSALIWVSHWLWRAIIVRSEVAGKKSFVKEFFSKQWLTAHFVAIGMFAPWLPFLFWQLMVVQIAGFWIPAVNPDTIINFFTNVIYYQEVVSTNGWFAAAFIALLIIIGYMSVGTYKSLNTKKRQSYTLILVLSFVPLIALFAFSMPPFRSSFVDRYLVASTLFIYAFLGITIFLGLSLIKFKYKIVIPFVVAIMLVVGVSNVWHLGNYSKTSNASNNAKEIVEAIKTASDGFQPIIADSPWLYYEAVHYETHDQPVFFIDANTEYKYGSLDMLKYNDYGKIKDIESFVDKNPVVWYVGLPRGAVYNAPYSDWVELKRLEVGDSINGKPAYVAIQYIIGE